MRDPCAPIAVALLGAGMIGATHATAYLLQSTAAGGRGRPVRLATVVDADPEAAEALARRFGFAASAADWREVLEDESIEAVSVALPNDLHFEVVAALLRRGKHVLCEKPLALTASEAKRLATLAEKAGVVAATSFNYRRIPAVAALKARIAAGDLGEPLQFSGHYHADYAADPMLPFSWRYERHRAGGGALIDIGAHLIDMARFLCGEIERVDGASIATIVGRRPRPAGRAIGHERGALLDDYADVDTDDVVSATLTFTNGCRGNLSISRVAIGEKNALGFVVSGRRATARYTTDQMAAFQFARGDADGHAEGFTTVLSDPSHPYVRHGMAMPASGVPYGFSEVFSFMVGDFLAAIRRDGGVTGRAFHDGYEAALVVEAIERAARDRRAVTLQEVRALCETAAGEASAAEGDGGGKRP